MNFLKHQRRCLGGFYHRDAVFYKQAGSDAVADDFGAGKASVIDLAASAGGASVFKHGGVTAELFCYQKCLFCSADIVFGDINTLFCYYAVTFYLGGNTGSGKAAKLLGADGDKLMYFSKCKHRFIRS